MKDFFKRGLIDVTTLAVSGAVIGTTVLLTFLEVVGSPSYQQVDAILLTILITTMAGAILGGLVWLIFRVIFKVNDRLTTKAVLGAIGGMVGFVFSLYLLTTPTAIL